MRAYIAYIRIYLKLTARDRLVLFFNYIFPLVFFFIFGQFLGAAQGGVASQVVAMVLIIGVLGNGLFGAGLRAVQERELNILRRFKVAPIGPAPVLVASLAIGWANYLPMALLVIVSAHFLYGMPMPENWISLIVFLSIAIVAFRSIGLIIASVVNSAQEGQIITQLLYFPMLFLSGATFPLDMLPAWVQSLAQFLPASHLFLGIQGILVAQENLLQIRTAVMALLLTIAVAMFAGIKLFRWEKEEKIPTASKMWLAMVLVPFLAVGAWQAHSRENLGKVKALAHEMRRGRTWLIRDARVFTGDGKVIESGSVLLKNGKVERVFEGAAPDASQLKSELIEASGKTLMPGLIDAAVDLSQSGGIPVAAKPEPRELAAYLYCGVTAVRAEIDAQGRVLRLQHEIDAGEYLGAQVFTRSAAMPRAHVSMLAKNEAADDAAAARADLLKLSLVQQVGPAALLESTRAALHPEDRAPTLPAAMDAAREAWRSGSTLVAGTGSGALLLIHGPAIHRELQLMVKAGIPPMAALQAATVNAAKFLGAEGRLGLVREGSEASLLLVDGNPLADISATERISIVFARGERVERSELLDQK